MTRDTTIQSKAHVLLIEDDAASREILTYVLRSAGFEVLTAAEGEEGIRLASCLRAEATSIILMDFQMPGVSGCELAKRLRQLCTAQIIAMSGDQLSEEALCSFDGFLLKPFDVPDLTNQLGETLRKAEQRNSSHSFQVLNEATFQKLYESMKEHALKEVYETCVTDAQQRILCIREAAEKKDFPAIKKLAHALRGGCAMLGMEELAECAHRLECAFTCQNDLRMNIEDLRSAFDRLQRILVTKFN